MGRGLGRERDDAARNYANSRGIPYMIITNGDDWRMYEVFASKLIEDRVIVEFSVARTSAYVCALRGLSMWRSSLSFGNEPIVAKLFGRLSLRDAKAHEYNKDTWRKGMILFPDGKSVSFTAGVDVLRESVRWLAENERLGPQTDPIRHPRKPNRYVFSSESLHPTGKGFRNPEKITGIHIEKDFDIHSHLVGTNTLLEHCGVDPGFVRIWFETG